MICIGGHWHGTKYQGPTMEQVLFWDLETDIRQAYTRHTWIRLDGGFVEFLCLTHLPPDELDSLARPLLDPKEPQ